MSWRPRALYESVQKDDLVLQVRLPVLGFARTEG